MNLRDELDQLDKTERSVFLALSEWMPVTLHQVYGALAGKSNSPAAKRIRKQTEKQILIWKHQREEGKRHELRGRDRENLGINGT